MICTYRRVIACCQPHGFLDADAAPDLLHGCEVLSVSDPDSDEAQRRLGELAEQYGWTRRPDGQWECSHHRAPAPGLHFAKAKVRSTAINVVVKR